MTRSALAIVVAATLAASAAMAQSTTTHPQDHGVTGTTSGDSRSSNPNRDTGASTATKSTWDSSSKDTTNNKDEKFLKDFAKANAAEVEAGKLAQQKAQNPEVKAFAKHMVDDHSKTIDKVQSIAGQTSVDVKDKPDTMHKAKNAMLDNKEGAAFDAAYMKAQVDDHQKVVEMLQKEIKEGQDANVKALASKALPDVQKHLKMAQDLEAKVSMDKNASKNSSRYDSSSDKTTTSSTRTESSVEDKSASDR